MLVEERILSIQEAFQIGKLEGELSGILRVLILAISLSLVWSENFIQAR